MTVEQARIGELAEQIRGVSYKKQDASGSPLPGYLPILRAGNIAEDGLTFEDLVYVPQGRISPKQKIRLYDVVIAASSGSIDVVGKAAPAQGDYEGSFGAFCKVLRPNRKVHPGYFAHFFKTREYRQRISAAAAGININNIRNEDLDNLSLLLPSIEEQSRIANILDKAEALRAKRRAVLAQLDELAQSIFLEMFGDPVTNPKRFEVVKSSEVFSDKPRIGTIKPASGSGFLLVRVGEIGDDEIRFDDCDRVELANTESDKFTLQEGDTAIARAIGSLAHLGKSSYFAGHSEPVVIDSHVMRLRPDPRVCHPRWFYELVSLPRGKVLLQKQGSATAIQFNINGTQASNLDIPLPPLALQKRFVDVVHSVYGQRDILRSHLTTLDDLFASLQQRAFKGEL